MLLSFKRAHLSISAFPDIELPPFAVIVGLNGSGKSHLLQAIANGSVLNSVVPTDSNSIGDPNPNIRLLGQDGRSLDLGQTYAPQGGSDAFAVVLGSFEQTRLRLLAASRAALDVAANYKVAEILQPGEDVWRLGVTEVTQRLGEGDIERFERIFASAEQAVTTPTHSVLITLQIVDHTYLERMLTLLQKVARKLSIGILQVSLTHLKLFAPWGSADQFHTNLPLLFGKYRDALVQNRLLRLGDAELGTTTAVSEEEFAFRFGNPPWDSINETLAAFSLPYEVTQPSLYDFDAFTVNLKKIGTDHIVYPQNLSSGEKILLQFAMSSFHYDEYFMTVSRPQLLLLDEMDSSLHPEMVNRWLSAVQNGLVRAQGLNCVITTHSPTTVALAPNDSLFEMKDGRSGLSKISKQDALNRLTYGVPTLSISYTGRRQVFAESDTDAAIYERVYAIIKSRIGCERELNFLSTGLRDKDNGEINAGCTIVKQTVDRLSELGNSSIFGLIDWDGEAVSTNRIKVVAEDERNGIENVLLDPLLIALLLMKERRLPEEFQDIDRFTGATTLEQGELQRLIDAIQSEVYPGETERVEISYLGGGKGDVLRAYLEADDHALEDLLATKFPTLKKWKNRGRGELVKAIVEHVLSEHPYFCPAVLPAVFEAIANAAD